MSYSVRTIDVRTTASHVVRSLYAPKGSGNTRTRLAYTDLGYMRNGGVYECLCKVGDKYKPDAPWATERTIITLDMVSSITIAFLKECTIPGMTDRYLSSIVNESLHSPEKMHRHYAVFEIPKKSGGTRVIEAPDDKLKTLQRAILHNAWYSLGGLRTCVQGFVPGRGTKTNAEMHFNPAFARKQFLLKSDFRDFFPSVTSINFYDKLITLTNQRRVRGTFFKVPPKMIAALKRNNELFPTVRPYIDNMPNDGIWAKDMADTETSREERKIAEGLFILLLWGLISLCSMDGRMPQGSPCSPAMTNLYLDAFHTSAMCCARMVSERNDDNVVYTIFADDMCVTANKIDSVLQMQGMLRGLVRGYPDISMNEAKTGIFKCGQPQKVTGVCITDRISISRQTRDVVRAELHNAATGRKTLDEKDKMRLKGMRAHIIGIDPEGWNKRCEPLFRQVFG